MPAGEIERTEPRPGLARRMLGPTWPPAGVLVGAGLTLLWAITCVLFARGTLPLRPYGDGAAIPGFLQNGYVYPRWPLGMLGLVTAYTAWPAMPLELIAATAMLASTWLLLQRWPNRLAVLLPMLTPVWWLFSSGYVEYYPFVAGAWIAALAWLFERPLRTHDGRECGVVAGLLFALYVGFAGLSALITIIKPKRALPWAAITAAVLLTICHPAGLPSFTRQLLAEMNFGEAHTMYRLYQGQAAGDSSICFRTAYALSWPHVKDLLYMAAFGGGPLTFVLFGLGAWRARTLRRDARVLAGGALVAWQVYYFVFMIPKMGPLVDVDLFFTTYLTVAFMAGAMLDAAAVPHRPILIVASLNLFAAVPLVMGWL
jgi:hypothetical protein